ncbi:hypothetical protein FQV27_00410 [Paracoccus aurantiacus]|uniref:Uncharacterized protein n=2 Tax=Paracoccus aurantiacus TaxID=2599412 RepID=A0A5C6SA60_9RHOB|nr:hypothetical protein FQV27_00410 [Paracoccus aurantiacus]
MKAVTRAALAIGITKGIDYVANRGKDPAKMTAEERKLAQKAKHDTRKMVKRARQAARISRRIR